MMDPLALFQNSNSYKHYMPQIRTLIQEPHYQTILNIFTTINNHLHQPNYDPFSKLLMMRFLKECILSANYPILTMINAHLVEGLFQFAIYRKSSTDYERGKGLFLNYEGKQHNQEYLKTIGFSFHKIVLEMFQKLGIWMKSTPHHEEPCLPSMITRKCDNLFHMNVKLNTEFTYFHERDQKEFQKNYQKKQKFIPFYEFIFQELIKNPTKTLPLIKNIIRSGDIYCSETILGCLKKYIQSQQEDFDYAMVIHELFLVGQVQVIFQIGKELLLELIQSYGKGLLPSRHGREITSWGLLLLNVEGVDDRIGRVFLEVSRKIKGCQSREITAIKKDFLTEWRSLRNSNYTKARFLDFTNPNEDGIIQALNCLSRDRNSSIVFQVEQQQVSSSQKSREKMLNYKLNSAYHFPRTPSQKSHNKAYQSPTFNMPEQKCKQFPAFEHKQEVKRYQSQKCPSFIDTLKMDDQINLQLLKLDSEALRTKRKIKKSQRLKTGQNESCPNFSEKNNSETQKKNHMTFDEYHFKQIEHKLEIYKYKEEKLNNVIKQQTKLIQKLQGQLTSNKNRSQIITSINSLQNLSTVRETTRRKIFIQPERLEKFLTPKLKSEILKKKILLFKNADIEVGLITNLNQRVCQASLYITPLINLYNVKVIITSPSWITHSIKQNSKKVHALADLQYIVKCSFNFIDTKGFLSLPELTLFYEKNSVSKEVKTFLPIFITKFCQEKVVNVQQVKNIMGERKCELKTIKKEVKFLGSFEIFSKYFQNAILIEDSLYAIKFSFEGIVFNLMIYNLDKKHAKVVLLSEGSFRVLQEILERAFISLLGI